MYNVKILLKLKDLSVKTQLNVNKNILLFKFSLIVKFRVLFTFNFLMSILMIVWGNLISGVWQQRDGQIIAELNFLLKKSNIATDKTIQPCQRLIQAKQSRLRF